MGFSLLERAKEFLRAQRKKNIWYRTMCGLAAVVVFVTTYMLILPAITMERKTICGQEEHTHTDTCYEVVTIAPPKVLSCTKEKLEIHKHTDKCYDSDHNLICGYADFVVHTHDENCYGEDGKLVCTLPEIKEHEHTASCYKEEQKLSCGQEVSEGHKHSEGCYTTEKGSLNCDVTEHTHIDSCKDVDGNYICGKEEHTHNDNCYQWNPVLVCTQAESTGHTHTDACYETVKTLICDEQEVILHTHTDACYDENGKMKCGMLEVKEHQHTDKCFVAEGGATTEKKLVCEKEEHKHTDACYPVSDEDAANVPMLLANGDDGEGTTGETTATNLQPYLTSVSGTGTKYNTETGYYDTNLRINFSISKATINTANREFIYTLPSGVIVPDDLLDKTYNGYDSNDVLGFTYKYIKDTDGNYSIKIHFDQTYVENAGDVITGFVGFKGMLAGSSQSTNGDLEVKFSDQVTLDIPKEDITYPGDETLHYDMKVEKSGSYVKEGNKIRFTVKICSQKGTPDSITVEDILSQQGLNISNVNLISVKKSTIDQWNNIQSGTTEDISLDSGKVTFSVTDNSKINISLPKLESSKCYEITYEYTFNEIESNQTVNCENTVKAEAEDKTKGETVKGEAKSYVTVTKQMLAKNGWYDSTAQKAWWELTINGSNSNITGAEITDTMFSKITEEGLKAAINPKTGYEIQKNDQGIITGIKFTALDDNVENTQKYTIKYATQPDASWNGSEISNQAKFDPDPDKEKDEIEETKTITAYGGSVSKTLTQAGEVDENGWIPLTWEVVIHVPSGGIPSGTEIKDGMYSNWGMSDDHWMSAEQADALVNALNAEGSALKDRISDIKFSADDYTWYTLEQLKNAPSLKVKQFYFTLTQELDGEKDIVFSYNSFVNVSTVTNTQYYKNEINVGGKKGEATYTYTPKVLKTDGNGKAGSSDITTKDGQLVWKAEIYLNQDCDTLIIEDQLPEGIVLEKLEYGALYEKRSAIPNENGTFFSEDSVYSLRMLDISESSYAENSGDICLNVKLDATVEADRPACLTKDNKFYVTYYCRIKDMPEEEGVTQQSYTNRISVTVNGASYGMSEQTQNVTIDTVRVTKTDGNGNTGTTVVTSQDGTVTWKVEVYLNDNFNQLVITDTLPSGVILEKISYGRQYEQQDASSDENGNIAVSGTENQNLQNLSINGSTYDLSTRKITLQVALKDTTGTRPDCFSKGNRFYITYICKAKDLPEAGTEKKYGQLTNKVEVTADRSTYGSSEQTQDVTVKIPIVEEQEIDKTGTWNNDDHRLNYSVDLNPGERDLSESQDTLTVSDVMRYQINPHYNNTSSLIQNTVKLYYAKKDENEKVIFDKNGRLEKGEEVNTKDWKWSFSTNNTGVGWSYVENTITAVIPDETALILEYSYQVLMTIPETWGTINLGVNNTATLIGDKQSQDSQSNNEEWKESETTAGVNTDKRYIFYKVDSTDYGIALSGAEFTLYKYNSAISEFEATGQIYTTSQGQFSLQWQRSDHNEDYQFEYNTAYYVKETKAPTGYLLPDAATQYYFYFSKKNSDTEASASSLPYNWSSLNPIDLSKSSHTEYCVNEKNTTEITVEKKWFRSDGTTEFTNEKGGSIQFDLYRKESKASSGGGGTSGNDGTGTSNTNNVTKIGTYTISNADGWVWSSNSLEEPLLLTGKDADNNLVTYIYYVKEHSTTNYTSECVNNEGISSGKITINNIESENPTFELPETGGPGTRIAYTLGSILMLLASAAFLYIKKRNDGKKGGLT